MNAPRPHTSSVRPPYIVNTSPARPRTSLYVTVRPRTYPYIPYVAVRSPYVLRTSFRTSLYVLVCPGMSSVLPSYVLVRPRTSPYVPLRPAYIVRMSSST